MTSGKVEQSRRKLQKLLWDGEQRSKRRALISWGITLEYSLVYLSNLSLVGLRALQERSMWGTSSNISEQASESWHVPRLLADQWLHRASVLYLPDAMTACTLAIAAFEGEEPAVVKRGCGDVMDIKHGLQNERDDIETTSNCKILSQ